MTEQNKLLAEISEIDWEKAADDFLKQREEEAQKLDAYLQNGFESDFLIVNNWLDKHGSFTDDGLAYKCIQGIEELIEQGFDCDKMRSFKAAMAKQNNQNWIEVDDDHSWMIHRGIMISTIYGQGSSTRISIATEEDTKEFNRKRTVESLGKIVLAKANSISALFKSDCVIALYIDGKLAIKNPDMHTVNAMLGGLGLERTEKVFDSEWFVNGPGTAPEYLHDAVFAD